MKSYFRLLGTIVLFWLIYFYVQQLIFLVFTYSLWQPVSLSQVLFSFPYAMSMNLSAIAYLLIIPTLAVFACILIKKEKLIRPIINTYMLVLSMIITTLCFVDISLMHGWGSKLNSKALYYMMFLRATFATVEGWFFVPVAIIYFSEIVLSIWFVRKIFRKIEVVRKGHFALWIISFIITTASIFIGIRGGFQDKPINRHWVYYSKYAALNNASMNSFWNLLDVVFNMESNENPYKYYTAEVAEKEVKEMFSKNIQKDSSFITVNRPNIVLVLLESWSADAIECMGGEKGITPGFDSLARQGILFTNFYASGFRTEQGIVALLCGFPAQPQTTIIRKFGKFEQLTNFVKIISANGYHSSYYYTGDLEFANTESFLKVSGFDVIYGEKNFEAKRRTRWGAYDEELFDFQQKDIIRWKEPFFSIIMSSTSHEPFTADVTKIRKTDDEPSHYLNTIHYTDSCLFDYIRKVKSAPWHKNTLFIITGDHAHYNPYNRSYNVPERHHIPLLFYGDVIRKDFVGKKINTSSYHPDIPATLCEQLNIKNANFDWGKNLFSQDQKHYAFYTFDNGFGLVQDSSYVVFDHNLGQVVLSKGTKTKQNELLKKGKALLQQVVQKYIDLNN